MVLFYQIPGQPGRDPGVGREGLPLPPTGATLKE